MLSTRFIVYILLFAGLSACVPVAQQPQQQRQQQADVHYKLGISYLQANNPTLALRELLAAVQNGPDQSAIHAALAQAYQLKKAYLQAERHYLQAIALSDNDPRYLNNLASLYLDLQQWDKAISFFTKAGSDLLFLNSHIALTGKGYALLKKQDYPAALQQLQEVILIAPRYAQAYYLLSETYQALGQTELARQTLEQVIDIAPEYAQAIYQLGVLLLNEQKKDAATEKFQRVVKLVPGSEWGLKSAEMLRDLAGSAVDKN